jgi:hypothetical protein
MPLDDEEFNGTAAWEKVVAKNKASKQQARDLVQAERLKLEEDRKMKIRQMMYDRERKLYERQRQQQEEDKKRKRQEHSLQFRQKLLAHALYALMKKRRFQYTAVVEKGPLGMGLSLQVSDQMVDGYFVGKEVTVKGKQRSTC